jgi:hypothetical protein
VISPAAAESATASRRLRLAELVLVVAVGYLPSVVYALHAWWNGVAPPAEDALSSLSRILRAVIAIAVLVYVLHRRGWTLVTIGLTVRWSDLPWALLVLFFSRLLMHVVAIRLAGFGESLPERSGPASAGLVAWMALVIVPSAAAEELIVRAFLMTEVAALTGSMAIAVLASVGFQTLYHLYQGLPSALMAAAMFFVFSVFYANLRRVTPLVLAHSLHNASLLALRF